MSDVRKLTLENGCTVLMRPTPDKPILSIMASARHGSRNDAVEQAGLANLTARLLTKGAGERNALDIAEAMESIGGEIDSFCSRDFMGIETRTVETDWPLALELLSDCLFRPTFDSEEYDKERTLIQSEIERAKDDKFSYAYRQFEKLFYRDHPYGHPRDGEVETVGALERDDVRELHAAAMRPEDMILTVVGNAPEKEFLKKVEQLWPNRSNNEPQRSPITGDIAPGRGRGETLSLTKDIEQSFIMVGYPAPGVADRQALAARLACAVLGEGMSARLFARLRDRDHLAYAVGSALVLRELASHLFTFIGTNPDTAEKALEGLRREAENLAHEPPDKAELERAREYVLGKQLVGLQTNHALAHSMTIGELWGLGWNWSEELPERMRTITLSELLEAADAYLRNPAIVKLNPSS